MTLELRTYRNSTELANLNGAPIYMSDMIDAALRGKLNIFLQGDTGSGKTQIVRDVMQSFGDKSLFILGRNDMDTRELFQQVNPEFLNFYRGKSNISYSDEEVRSQLERFAENARTTPNDPRAIDEFMDYLSSKKREEKQDVKFKELTDKIHYHFIAVDELSNCVPAVRAQLFNLFDGFIEIDGKTYPIGLDYCVGMATGNMGQQFTESSNELGRALRDRMHLIIDTDYFRPQPTDTWEMLAADRNPRVKFDHETEDKTESIISVYKSLQEQKVPFEKYIVASYLIHGLDWLPDAYGGSKTALKSLWPNKLEGHEAGSDESLILPVSPRAAKSIITLSQALDEITIEKGIDPDYLTSMMTAFKFAAAYSGILNEALVRQTKDEDHYKAMDAVIETTTAQIDEKRELIAAGIDMASKGKKDKKLLDGFSERWNFMGSLLENFAERENDKTAK